MKAIRPDGTVRIRVIAPGWGSSGHYSAAVLKRDGPKVFKAGLQMFANHPTPQEEAQRPERSISDLAGVLASDARWEESGPHGPGLYATAKIFGGYIDSINEMAPHIGVSIRAMGQAKQGEAEGRKGAIIEAITAGRSVDFVTLPGAGGAILSESRGAIQPPVINTEPQEVQNMMTEAEQKELSDVKAENARLREAQQLREAAGLITATLAEAKTLPTITRARLAKQLANSGVFVEGKLDEAATKAAVEATIKDELDYLTKINPTGRISGMGDSTQVQVTEAALAESLAASFEDMGWSASTAKLAANRK